MSIHVACKCGKEFDVPERMAGKAGKCPACGGRIEVPDPNQAPDPDQIIFDEEPEEDNSPAPSSGKAGCFCRSCGKGVNPDAVVCPACGVPPKKGKEHCSSCGAATKAEQVLCTQCGCKLGGGGTWDAPEGGYHIGVLIASFFVPLVGFVYGGILINKAEGDEQKKKQGWQYVLVGVVGFILFLIGSSLNR